MRKIEFSLIVVVAIFTAIILPVFGKEHVMELGSTSDILSAFCNVAMAAAAVYAAFKAMDWVNDKKSHLAFDQAISTLIEFDKVKLQIDLFHNNLVINQKTLSHKELCEFSEDEFLKLQHSILTFIRNIHNSERFGFNVKPDLKQKISKSFSEYLNVLYKIFERRNLSPEMIAFHIMIETRPKQFTELESIHKDTNTVLNMMKKGMDDIFVFNSK